MILAENEKRIKNLVSDKAYLMALKLEQLNSVTMERSDYRSYMHHFFSEAQELVILAKELEREAYLND